MSEANGSIDTRIENFDPEDPEALAQFEKDLMGEEAGTEVLPAETATGEEEQRADGAAKESDAKQDEAAAEAEGDTSGQATKVIKTRDNKHEIPYAVLEKEREARARAEATARALQEQIQSLEKGEQPGAEGGDQLAVSDDELAEIDEVSPEIAKVIRWQKSQIEQLTGYVKSLTTEQEVSKQTREQEARDEIESAISSNADLNAWREAASREDNPDTSMWDRAASVDAALRNDPFWKERSYAERFAKVAESVKTLYGVETAQPSAKEQADLKAAADAKLKEKGDAVPTSLSDFPGGAAPAQSDVETLENASSVSLGQKFMDMTPEQMESYLARLA